MIYIHTINYSYSYILHNNYIWYTTNQHYTYIHQN